MSCPGEDAYAATIMPASVPGPDGAPLPVLATPPIGTSAEAATPRPRRPSVMESEETMAAPVTGVLAPLPIVSHEHYGGAKEIARGGMGRIVAAEDHRLGRPVALKELIDPAADQVGRFQREALITARLQHPGIVPVYEAGRWPTGEPFFAMKLVSGRPLDKVIGEARTLEQRLELLPRIAAAADAIAYAHSQRVIHRDLKPGNILIGDFGETVVIDWGLAKDLDAVDGLDSGNRLPRAESSPRRPTVTSSGNSTMTVAGAVMGTPAYMAPEQARGEPLDQRADVFALGAMLYHLLAGVPPYNARTATDVIAAAALGRVVPLEERERATPKDLLAIVNRAMAQEATDRYPHAGELADELRRFLTGQLVDAHRYTTAQKLARFVRRHRAAVTISVLSIVAFAVFASYAFRQIIQQRDAADRQRQIADTRRGAAEKLIDELLSGVTTRLADIGRLDVMSSMGGEIRDYYDTLATMPGGMADGDGDRMATAVDLVGLAERESGRLDQALATWTDARAKLAATVAGDTTSRTLFRRRMIARFDFEIGTVHQQRGKIAEAITSFNQANQGFDGLRAEAPRDRLVLLQSAETHDRLGDLLRNEGKIDQAFEEYAAAKSARESAGSGASSRPSEDRLALSVSHMKLGSVYLARGESATALESYRAALRLRQALLESQPDNVTVLEKVLDVQDNVAEVQRQIGDDQAAIASYRDAVVAAERLTRRDATNTTWKRQRGNLVANLGFSLLDVGEFKAGIDQLQLALELQRELIGQDPKALAWQGDLSRTLTRAGDGRLYLGEIDKGIERYRAALDIRRRLARTNPTSAPYRRSVAWSYAKLANAYVLKGDVTRAIGAHEDALELRAALAAEAPAHSGFRNELASTEITLGRVIASRDPRRSKLLVTAGMIRARALVAGDPINHEWKETLTQALLAEAELTRVTGDRAARALALAEARTLAHAAAERAPQNAHWPGYVAEVHVGLAEIADDPKVRVAEWRTVYDVLAPLAAAGRLAAPRRPLLDRARTAR